MPACYYVYILKCTDGRFYTGYTVDLIKRFSEHTGSRKGAKFTRSFKPVKIIASWEIAGKRGDAMKVEAFIKSLPKAEKILITENPELLAGCAQGIKELDCKITVYDYQNIELISGA